jgi:hypothetical protein
MNIATTISQNNMTTIQSQPSWVDIEYTPASILRIEYPDFFSEWSQIFNKLNSDFDFIEKLFPSDEINIAELSTDYEDPIEADEWKTISKKTYIPPKNKFHKKFHKKYNTNRVSNNPCKWGKKCKNIKNCKFKH